MLGDLQATGRYEKTENLQTSEMEFLFRPEKKKAG